MRWKSIKIAGSICALAILALWGTYLYININFSYGVFNCAHQKLKMAPSTACRLYLHTVGISAKQADEINFNGTLIALLDEASAVDREDLLTALIKSGVSINGKDRRLGLTPLHGAVFMNTPYLIPLLLAHGADPRIKDEQRDQTPLEFAEALAQKRPDIDRKEVIRVLKTVFD